MDVEELTGTYTYRAYVNRPEPVASFATLRFAQLELRLSVQANGTMTGMLIFPAPAGAAPPAMDVTGHATEGLPVKLRFTGKGRAGSSVADFHYEYDGFVLPHWEAGISQRLTLAGTVLRAEDHGSGATLAEAGETASFLAVRRDA